MIHNEYLAFGGCSAPAWLVIQLSAHAVKLKTIWINTFVQQVSRKVTWCRLLDELMPLKTPQDDFWMTTEIIFKLWLPVEEVCSNVTALRQGPVTATG